MTTAAGAPPAQQPPPPPPDETAILAALTVILLTTQPVGAAVAQVQSLFSALNIAPEVSKAAFALAVGSPSEYPADISRALAHVRRTGMPRRAAYVLSAARRLATGGDIETERRYLGQHLAAERSRVEAAQSVDRAAAEFGPVLGWRARMDDITTRACRAAHRHNFNADHPPTLPRFEEGHQLVGYPGTLHGGSCRCIPAPPWPGAILLD